MKNVRLAGIVLIAGIFLCNNTYAFGGWAGVPHLIKIVVESKKRYRQLQSTLSETKAQHRYLKQINSGLDLSLIHI